MATETLERPSAASFLSCFSAELTLFASRLTFRAICSSAECASPYGGRIGLPPMTMARGWQQTVRYGHSPFFAYLLGLKLQKLGAGVTLMSASMPGGQARMPISRGCTLR